MTDQDTKAIVRQQHPALALIESRRETIEILGTPYLSFDKARASFANAMLRNKKLESCTDRSLLDSFIRSYTMGIDTSLPNMGHFIPRGNECTFQIGYAGLMELARRPGLVSRYKVRAVYEGDHFEVSDGTDDDIRHRPDVMADRTKPPIHYYAIAFMVDGSCHFKWMSAPEVERVKQHYAASNSPAWSNPHARVEMAFKTVIRSMLKWMPMSPELAEAMAEDDDYALPDRTDDRAPEIASIVQGQAQPVLEASVETPDLFDAQEAEPVEVKGKPLPKGGVDIGNDIPI